VLRMLRQCELVALQHYYFMQMLRSMRFTACSLMAF
jgi:hypothetical protein